MKIRPALRYTLSVLALIPFTLAPVGAEAKPKASKAAAEPAPAKKKSLALAPLEGKKNAEVRGWLRDALKSGFELTDAEDFKVKADPAAYAKMGGDLGVDAVVVGKVEKTKLTVTIYQASDGRVLIALQFKAPPGPKLKSIIDKRLVQKLYGAFGIESPDSASEEMLTVVRCGIHPRNQPADRCVRVARSVLAARSAVRATSAAGSHHSAGGSYRRTSE